MRQEFSPLENKLEKFREVELNIKEPDKIHGYEIIFDEEVEELVSSYNGAIDEICNQQKNLGVFHQCGRGNESGYHAWEFLGSKTDSGKIKELFPLINEEAKRIASSLYNL